MSEETENSGPAADPAAPAQPALDFPVVGIGASAGGIAALRKFFSAVPEKPGMAFIVVLHLSPEHESHLADLLRKVVTLPLTEVEGDTAVERDHVYVITPKHALTLEDGTIRVNPAGESPRHPVDTLFRSLATEQREKAVAVVLSGTGTNGTGGAIRVKEEGGIVLVQDPETAEHQGMPQATIGAGVADRVLAPDAMAQELLALAAHAYVRAPAEASRLQDGEEQQLNAILAALRTRAAYDFHGYKTTTLLRRIRRRMGLRRMDELGEYAAVLRDDPAEAEDLVRDMLISVTAFFRDRAAWEELEKLVIEPLVRDRESGQPMRVWVPACSTGEEAYSLAMLLLDCAEAADKAIDLKVFATDAAPHVLARARTGRFAASVAEEMPPDRLERHFEKRGDYYQASKKLREAIVFAPQKLMHDPPFSRMDLVSCRNLLIYLGTEAQKRVTALLHFALREGGYLFLGTAEGVGEREDMFQTVSKKWRIYRRIGPTRHDIVDFPVAGHHHRPPETARAAAPAVQGPAQRARQALLEHFAPPSVLIDEHFHVHFFHGETERFLDQPRGEPTRDLLSLAKRGLAARLRAAVHRAMRDGEPVTVDAHVEGPERVPVRLSVTPLGGGEPRRLLVSFLRAGDGGAPPAATIESDERLPRTENELEDALRASRAELRETVEQLEGSNEELKASNEEITSMNEELQSTNEELETSKEEMQSLNEELNTVNVQLQNKVAELEERTHDLDNLLSSSAVATLFLDREMRIRFATPAVRDLLDVLESDIGRPVSHLAQKFEDPDFVEDARAVLKTLQPREREVGTGEGRWFERQIVPYRAEDRIEGVVVTFSDVTERRRSEQEVAAAREFAESIVETVRHPLLVLDPSLNVVSVNDAFCQTYKVSRDEGLGRRIYDVGGGQWDLPELRRLLDKVLPHDKAFDDLAMAADFRDIGHRDMLLNGRRLDHVQLILLAIEDVTDRRRAERAQQALLDELQHRVKNLFANIKSLLRMTSEGAGSVEGFLRRFSTRLEALERTQDVLSREGGRGVDLKDLVAAEMEAHGAPPNGQVSVEGEPVRLSRRTAQALAMAVHELATNGLKYGALAHGGDVHASWQRSADGERLVFRWRETGVPGGAKALEGGFGSKLIREVVPYMLGGTSELEATDDGVRCVIEVPLEGKVDRSRDRRDADGEGDG